MKKTCLLPLLVALLSMLMLGSCMQQQMQRQARESQVVVLDIGHYYHPERGGQGARTPDKRYGKVEELDFWYRYAIYTKRVIEKAGYKCIICNRGATPTDPVLAAAGKRAGVVQINSPQPTAVYRSRHNPKRMAVGMLSADYALDCKPGAVVFLHHNSVSHQWREDYDKGAMYCNEVGIPLAQQLAWVMNRDILDHDMPNGGQPCGVIVRNDGRLGGGDWLNTCNDSYVPAVITEVAVLSNPKHAQYLAQKQNAINFAEAVGRGIVEFMQQR